MKRLCIAGILGGLVLVAPIQVSSYEARRDELWRAIQTRILTDKEYQEALAFGRDLNIRMQSLGNGVFESEGYNAEDKARQLAAAFERQNQLIARENLIRSSKATRKFKITLPDGNNFTYDGTHKMVIHVDAVDVIIEPIGESNK